MIKTFDAKEGHVEKKYFYIWFEDKEKLTEYYDYDFNRLNIPMEEWRKDHEVSWRDEYFLKSRNNRLSDGRQALKSIDFHSWRGDYISTVSFESIEGQVVDGVLLQEELILSSLNSVLIHEDISLMNITGIKKFSGYHTVCYAIGSGRIKWVIPRHSIGGKETIKDNSFYCNLGSEIIKRDLETGEVQKIISIFSKKELPFQFSKRVNISEFTESGNIWFGVYYDKNIVIAIDISTGEIVWHEELKGEDGAYFFQVEPKVYVHENRLYVITRQSGGADVFNGYRLHVYEKE